MITNHEQHLVGTNVCMCLMMHTACICDPLNLPHIVCDNWVFPVLNSKGKTMHYAHTYLMIHSVHQIVQYISLVTTI